jgi:hypothetical protein
VDTRRWLLPGLAAGAVVLVAAGTAVGLAGRDRDPAAAPPGTPAPPPAAAPATDPARLLVRDGDRVTVTGGVQALPGRPVRMCAPAPVALPGYPEGQEPPPAYCDLGVTVRGLDLATVPGRKVVRGVVTGQATVRGTYRAGVVTVDRQSDPEPTAERPSSLPERPPCPAPAGGWRAGETDVDRLVAYLEAHQDRYVDLWLTYPDGYPKRDDGTTPRPSPVVPVVGTVLDPAAAEPGLRSVHSGNLCVVRVKHPSATLKKVTDRITAGDPARPAHGVYAVRPDGITGTVDVELVVLDPAAQRWLRQADGRSGTVVAHPWIRPAR